MSANLWSDAMANRHARADGTYLSGANKLVAELFCTTPGLAPLAENQTIHMSASLLGDGSGYLKPFVKYEDAAHNVNYVGFPHWTPSDSWQRFEGTCVVPSGMTVTKVGFNNSKATGDIEVSNPVFSYGGPVVLASAWHTHHRPAEPVVAAHRTKGDRPARTMELTFTDAAWHDLGLIRPSEGDFAWGADENDFSIDVYGRTLPPVGGLLYLDGSDVGGIVTGYANDTRRHVFSVLGDTWTGVLDRHVIGPPAGSDYRTVSGDARDCVAEVVSLAGMGGVFHVSSGRTGIHVDHTFKGARDSLQRDAGRYMGAWAAVWQLVLQHGLSVSFAWDGSIKRVRMTVTPRKDRTDAESQQAGLATLGVTTDRPTNHLVCLGQGDLKDRTVVHLYADRGGGVSTTQSISGVDEIAEVYDDTGAQDAAKLEADGRKKLKELWAKSQEVTIQARAGVTLALGDLIGGTDARSGIGATAVVSKRVLSFRGGVPSYTYTSTVRS